MTLLQLKYFMEIAKYGSFSETARHLFVAQPAITKQINALEKELQFQLFNRTSHGVELTESGKILLSSLQRCSSDFQTSIKAARNVCSYDTHITIGIITMVAMQKISSQIYSFLDIHPELSIEIRRIPMMSILSELDSHHIDAAIVFGEFIPNRDAYDIFDLMMSRDFLITSKKYPLFQGTSISEVNTSVLPVVAERASGNFSGIPFGPLARVYESLGFKEENVIYYDNYETCLALAEGGKGVMIADEATIFPDRDAFAFLDTGHSHAISILCLKNNHRTMVEELFKYLKNHLS